MKIWEPVDDGEYQQDGSGKIRMIGQRTIQVHSHLGCATAWIPEGYALCRLVDAPPPMTSTVRETIRIMLLAGKRKVSDDTDRMINDHVGEALAWLSQQKGGDDAI
jgi:hypothetical protein